MTESVPLLVLGCHRSGTSAVTGLLHVAAGMDLGDTLPPGADNPKGYFESLAIVEAHKYLLQAMDRDWTCPPAYFEPTDDATDLIREALAPLLGQPKPKAVKDPRLLFTLPPWTQVLPAMRFIGVIRDPGAVANSIASRNHISQEGANRIVSAYIKRLADLHRLMPFPVISFDDDYEQMLGRVQGLAQRLGLGWDDGAARRFFTPSLVHHRGSLSSDENYHYLLEASRQPIDEPAIYSSEKVAETLLDVRTLALEELPRTYGPRFTERRQSLWQTVLKDSDRVDGVLELIPADSSKVPLTMADRLDQRATVEVPANVGSIQKRIRSAIPPSHILGAGILDSYSQEQVATLLSDLGLRARTHAVLYLDGPTGSKGVIEASLDGTSWNLDNVEATVGDREIVALSKSSDVFRQADGTVDPERVLLSLDARLSALERDTAWTRKTQISTQSQEEIQRLTSRNHDLEKRVESAVNSYQRLANRRSVRIALRLAGLFRPLFQWRRRS